VTDTQSASADRDQVERGVRRLEPEHRTVIVLHCCGRPSSSRWPASVPRRNRLEASGRPWRGSRRRFSPR
jgi:hypothetical protein